MLHDVMVAKVNAVNTANGAANYYDNVLREIFRPFVGQKVVNANGQFIKKIRDLLGNVDLPNNIRLRVFRYKSNYNIAYSAKSCENTSGRCVYHETLFYIGSLKGGVLKELTPSLERRSNYTVCEVSQAYEKFEALSKEASKVIEPYYMFRLT